MGAIKQRSTPTGKTATVENRTIDAIVEDVKELNEVVKTIENDLENVTSYIEPIEVASTVISFTDLTIYNSVASPATGNITNDLTGAKKGIIQKIYHQHTSAPTFPAGWVLRGGGIYVPSTLNIIYATFCGGTRVEYWIA